MTNIHSAVRIKNLLIIGVLLGGCYAKPAEDSLKINVRYWTHTGTERCVNLADVPYCFLNKDIEASSFATDASAGFLFMAPTDDPDLVECDRDHYQIDWEQRPYPNIQMTVGEVRSPEGDTIEKKYRRVYDLQLSAPSHNTADLSRNYILEPRKYIDYFGEKCLKLSDEDLLQRDALCFGGNFEEGEPAYFWACRRDGKDTYPSCKYRLFYKNLEYTVTVNKKCAPFMNEKIRDFALNFVERGKQRSKDLSIKSKQLIQ